MALRRIEMKLFAFWVDDDDDGRSGSKGWGMDGGVVTSKEKINITKYYFSGVELFLGVLVLVCMGLPRPKEKGLSGRIEGDVPRKSHPPNAKR